MFAFSYPSLPKRRAAVKAVAPEKKFEKKREKKIREKREKREEKREEEKKREFAQAIQNSKKKQ